MKGMLIVLCALSIAAYRQPSGDFFVRKERQSNVCSQSNINIEDELIMVTLLGLSNKLHIFGLKSGNYPAELSDAAFLATFTAEENDAFLKDPWGRNVEYRFRNGVDEFPRIRITHPLSMKRYDRLVNLRLPRPTFVPARFE